MAKSDVDMVADLHYRETQTLLRKLLVKLYKRNPAELARRSGVSVEQRLEQLFAQPGPLRFDELSFAEGTDALELALRDDYPGDRVMAVVTGLNGMIRHAYDYKDDFYLFDQLHEQKLYDSARNVEILVWKLSLSVADGRPVLLTNNLPGEEKNLSFERLFGKLIGGQDMMAQIASQQNDRLISRMVQNVASLAFFPL